jgi:hypothetical protein
MTARNPAIVTSWAVIDRPHRKRTVPISLLQATRYLAARGKGRRSDGTTGAADWVSVSGSPSVSWAPAYESTQAEQDGNQYYWETRGRLWRKRFELDKKQTNASQHGSPETRAFSFAVAVRSILTDRYSPARLSGWR